jgi:hypothetical protein
MMADIGDKVCRHHPERAAVTKCETCFTPLCGDCVVESGGLHFCSEKCASNYAAVANNISRFEDQRARDIARRRRRRMIRVLIFAGIVTVAGWYVATHPELIDRVKEALRGIMGGE